MWSNEIERTGIRDEGEEVMHERLMWKEEEVKRMKWRVSRCFMVKWRRQI